MKRLSIRICTLKVLLVILQIERRNVVNGGKESLCMVVESLADLVPAVRWKVEFINEELGYIAEEIPQ